MLGDNVRDAGTKDKLAPEITHLVLNLCQAAITLNGKIAQGHFGQPDQTKAMNGGGDEQKPMDVIADTLFHDALKNTAVGYYVSEEQDHAIVLDETKSWALFVDPLDGSSNIEIDISIGTIFSLVECGADKNLLQTGESQILSGFFIYGPQMALVLAYGAKTDVYRYDPIRQDFFCSHHQIQIPPDTKEFAINFSNYRHWDQSIRYYIDDCLKGAQGVRKKDFNTRWVASMVADAYRILMRGGVYLYPADSRASYQSGRLRLLYECNPIAQIIINAGGKAIATDGDVLTRRPQSLHQRLPFIFGSKNEVDIVTSYFGENNRLSDKSPLFGNRGLFRD